MGFTGHFARQQFFEAYVAHGSFSTEAADLAYRHMSASLRLCCKTLVEMAAEP